MTDTRKIRSFGTDVVFIGPVLVLYAALFVLPFLDGLRISMTSWDGVSTTFTYVGLRNYVNIFTTDVYFLDSLGKTFRIAFLNVIATNTLAMLFALALTTKFRSNNAVRAVIFAPIVMSMVVIGFVWRFLFSQVGPKLAESTGLDLLGVPWLGDADLVIYATVIVSLWQGLGYIMTIYIAGLQGIDSSLIEAGSIDGCNDWQSFWKIKLPSMLPVVSVGLFLNIAGSLKIFDTIYSLTGGGPGKSSEVAMLNLYREAFVYGHFGTGAAKAFIMTLIIILVTIVQRQVTERRS